MLKPRYAGQRAGLDALLEANRPDLTVEAIIISDKFRALFTTDEISVARERLGDFGRRSAVAHASRERLYPDDLPPGPYVEGAKKQVRVNAHERNPRARAACIAHYGTTCSVCGINFADVYGKLGEAFIHIHHLRAVSLCDGEYRLNAVEDLRPVCPNCHAMLHRGDPLLSIQELKEVLERNRKP
ncbi:MAG: HNH endonuclease [bacterium]|uniref:HNH endonuclease n=1 Tax=Candidatus Methylomirabilis tolerans TaxID=3123416 RepID=A0AAJ1AGZ8_9BACT|nr:HNH endonuclease [Candidatus Methylomirabilis sp.]